MIRARFDASSSECLVFTWKSGLLSAAAHDLKLRVERFEVAVEPDAVRARFDAASLRVVCARAGNRDLPGVLSERDRREIEATVARTVLMAQQHPWIAFEGQAPQMVEQGYRVEGTLSLRGQERPLAVVAARQGGRAIVDALIHQPDFGIQPYTAMLGALRIKPDVAVQLVVPWRDPEPESAGSG